MGYLWGLSKALLRALREQKRQDGHGRAHGAAATRGRGRDARPGSPGRPAMPRGEESGIK
ncbi:hypothetical protein ACFVH6_15555 [Spirillospora sp. NPDC127200]